MTMPAHIVIAGGGTAGWLSALILQDAAKRAGLSRRITVIESSRIGTVGVGEGTTALFRQMLQHLGIPEEDFLRETGAAIKYGIRHQDWRRMGHFYDGPIDDPQALEGPGLDAYAVAAGKPVTGCHLFQHLMNAGRAPLAERNGKLIPAGPFQHAYHFDQAKAGRFLKRRTQGVEVIDDQIGQVSLDPETGNIRALELESGRAIAADFFLDCTGFRRVLIKALGARWLSHAGTLPVNRAMPFWLDHDPGSEIPPYTLAWAQKNGWMWQIPTDDRIGCGYVYSDAHLEPEDAQREIEAVLGRAIEPRNDIRIEAGRLDRAWIGNCVAIGLSSSFLEPLEATSIHGTLCQLVWLARWLGNLEGPGLYNRATAGQVDDFRDFIRLHYVSERRDSPFWRDIAATHPQIIQDRLALWQTKLPDRADFPPLPGDLPHVQEQLHIPVLDGLGLLNRAAARKALAETPKRRAQLRKAYDQLSSEYRRAARQCVPHRLFLRSLQQDKAA
jgi:2-polyprenyl-6-methoxyphenol hydroxylase-like FAD-dependent oxidoreductase